MVATGLRQCDGFGLELPHLWWPSDDPDPPRLASVGGFACASWLGESSDRIIDL